MKKIILLLVVLLAFGCIEPVQNLGCCIKANATDPSNPGCVLYNTTTLIEQPEYFAKTIACDLIGGCNVTVDGIKKTIPICTADQIVPCIAPNCVAMVCGDYAYKPHVAPAFLDLDDAAGNAPPNLNDEAGALQFYKAQCRYLPMDASLRQVMKNSKSQINVFRMGAGGSFDEFDQYRYYFPVSDKYCSINQALNPSDIRVDRYMNYLDSSKLPYDDPINDINQNCVEDPNAPGPFKFSESAAAKNVDVGGNNFGYEPVLPDKSNYKFAQHGIYSYLSTWTLYDGIGGTKGTYIYNKPFMPQSAVYKKIDDPFYRKYLSIAHAGRIYGLEGNEGDTRAPFECDMGANDCYSGSCDKRVYNRGVMVKTPGLALKSAEVVTDCNQVQDENGMTKVICAPTKSVTLQGAGQVPKRDYATVEIYPAHIESSDKYFGSFLAVSSYKFGDIVSNEKLLDVLWDNFEGTINLKATGVPRTITNTLSAVNYAYASKNSVLCAEDYSGAQGGDDDTGVFCSGISEDVGPPVGGAVFFGKLGDKTVKLPDGSTVIGYALTTPKDFKDVEFVKNCNITFKSSNLYAVNQYQLDFSESACVDYCDQKTNKEDGAFTEEDYKKHKAEYPARCLDNYAFSSVQCNYKCENEGNNKGNCVLGCLDQKLSDFGEKVCETYDKSKGQYYTQCKSDCKKFCSGLTDSEKQCSNYCATGSFASDDDELFVDEDAPPLPEPSCSLPAVTPEKAVLTDDFVRVEINSPKDLNWKNLMRTFKPYFEERLKAIGTTGSRDCDGTIVGQDAVLSSIPWIIDYEKGLNDPVITEGKNYDSDKTYGYLPVKTGYHMSSTIGQALRERNIYDESMNGDFGTNACEMSSTSFPWFFYSFDANFYYNIAFSRYIYLFKYKPGSKAIGECAVDDNTYLPEVKTFGWCDSCTTSTLAYQNITTYDRVYMPGYDFNIDEASGKNGQRICTAQYTEELKDLLNYEITENVSCFNPYITDISDYHETIGSAGNPRTSPNAAIMKERLGNYLKSGIMPVLDLSDNGNWNRHNPDSDLGSNPKPGDYGHYDFENLFGNMGAIVVIVDHVTSENEVSAKLNTINERAAIIHEKCFGCMVAFQVDDTVSNETFKNIINDALGDPATDFNIDLVTFNYEVSKHNINDATKVAENLESYGRILLQNRKKPSMVVGFNVEGGAWNNNNYKDLFEAIINHQNALVKAGIMGIVYSPVRDTPGGAGLVDLSGGVGIKGAKFCGFENAMQRMSTLSPVALFTRVIATNSTLCVACTSLDKANDLCGPPKGKSSPICDNGVACIIPEGLNANDAKCPESTVVNQCKLCSEMSGTYSCTKTFTNGTVQQINGNLAEINSDIYLDVIGGIAKPNKCCLEVKTTPLPDEKGGENLPTSIRYTYTKKSFPTPVNKPIVFPKGGEPNVDCGFGADAESLSQITSFCDIQQVPLKDYDIECSVGE